MSRSLRDIIAMAETEGLVVLKVEKGNHNKLHVRSPDGLKCMMVCPSSGSDRRGMRNLRSFMRKIAAGESPIQKRSP